MGVFSNSAIQSGRRWFVWLSLLALGLSLLSGLVLWQSVETSSVMEVQDLVEVLKPLFTGLRVLTIALIAIFWPRLVNWFHRRRRFESGIYHQLQALRWRVVTWLVIIELILGQNLSGRFLSILQGSTA